MLQGLLFAIGGYLEGKTSTDAVECYNPRTKRFAMFTRHNTSDVLCVLISVVWFRYLLFVCIVLQCFCVGLIL